MDQGAKSYVRCEICSREVLGNSADALEGNHKDQCPHSKVEDTQ